MNQSGLAAIAAAVQQRLGGLGTVFVDGAGAAMTLVPSLPGAVWVVTPNDEDCYALHGGVAVAINMTGRESDLVNEIAEQILAATGGQLVEFLKLTADSPQSVGWELSFSTGRAHAGTLTGPDVVALRYPAWTDPDRPNRPSFALTQRSAMACQVTIPAMPKSSRPHSAGTQAGRWARRARGHRRTKDRGQRLGPSYALTDELPEAVAAARRSAINRSMAENCRRSRRLGRIARRPR